LDTRIVGPALALCRVSGATDAAQRKRWPYKEDEWNLPRG